jgi:DNA processing protein
VSGFARDIDTSAHQGALGAGGRTNTVLGNGLSVVYPEANRKLADEVIGSGVLISEFSIAMAANFSRRNRVISDLRHAC